jgi:hypothetical protein
MRKLHIKHTPKNTYTQIVPRAVTGVSVSQGPQHKAGKLLAGQALQPRLEGSQALGEKVLHHRCCCKVHYLSAWL